METASAAIVTPGSFGPAKQAIATKPKKATDANAIWEEEEVVEADEIFDPNDTRPAPE
jgi:hypothetical protein